MKKCSECNIEMIEETNLHTDFVGGYKMEEKIYLSYSNNKEVRKNIFGINSNHVTKVVKARVCPNCGKVELFIDNKS